jgi:hypothetical protein
VANLSVNVPDPLVPRLIAALQHRYSDLDGTPDAKAQALADADEID